MSKALINSVQYAITAAKKELENAEWALSQLRAIEDGDVERGSQLNHLRGYILSVNTGINNGIQRLGANQKNVRALKKTYFTFTEAEYLKYLEERTKDGSNQISREDQPLTTGSEDPGLG